MSAKNSCTDGAKTVLVCDECRRACCWHGEFMCDNAKSAGLVVKTVDQLRALGLEHEDNWTDAKMIEVYGNSDRNFR